MKKYITNLHGHSAQSTAMHAQHMISKIANEMGYLEISLNGHPTGEDTEEERKKRIEGMLASVSGESLIIAQMPSWNGIAFDEVFLKVLRERAQKLVVFVHDFVPLMFANNRYLFSRYVDAYNLADLVILPSDKMGNALREEGLKCPVMVQEVWDHVTALEELDQPRFEKKLKFAGNTTRFPFVKAWQGPLPLEVFSNGPLYENQNLKLMGWMHDDALLRELNKDGFGLVWSEDIDNQFEREYSEMNVSFKFSTYLAAGLPLVVNKGLAKQSFVEEHEIGIVAESLEDAIAQIDAMRPDTYRRLQKNVAKIAGLVQEGFFTKKMLIELQAYLYLGERNDNL